MTILRLYARLLRLYPRAFYQRFGAEMQTVFAQAWNDTKMRGFAKVLIFCLHEYGGLLVGAAHAHLQKRERPLLRVLFHWRILPLWFFAFSLITAALFSLNYWGYLAVPSSTFTALHSVDSIVLAQYNADYRPTPLPLGDLPVLVTPDFPPSQILPLIAQREPNAEISSSLDPALAEMLAAALAKMGIDLANREIEYPTEPVRNPNGCGMNCFWVGVQHQADGSLLEIFPQIDNAGNFTGESSANRLTPEDWRYYPYFMPAGYIVQGHSEDGTPLVFAAIASGAVSNDHYRYYEFVFTQEANQLVVQDRLTYAFDIAGIEGFTFPVLTMTLFVPLLLLWLVLVVVGLSLAFVLRRVSDWRTMGRA